MRFRSPAYFIPPYRRKRSPSHWLPGFAAAAIAGVAYAGPPFITDDPEPVEYRSWEINYGVTALQAASAVAGTLPGVDINYGIAPGVQLHAQPQLSYNRTGGASTYGLGDTELGVKWRLTPEQQDEREWMIGIYPMLELPTGDASRQLGAGSHSLYLPVWFQTTRGPWTVFGGGGYRFNSSADARNAWAGGWSVLYEIRKGLQFGGEVFAATADTAGGSSSTGFNLGGIYSLGEKCSLLFSAGRGLSHVTETDQGAAYLGLRITY